MTKPGWHRWWLPWDGACSVSNCERGVRMPGGGSSSLGAPWGLVVAPGPITASLNGQIIAPGTLLWQAEVADGEHPLILAQNEGFSIRSVAVPATGTWTAAIDVQWAEMSSY